MPKPLGGGFGGVVGGGFGAEVAELETLGQAAVPVLHELTHPAVEDRIESIDRVSLALLVADDGLADLRGFRKREFDGARACLRFDEADELGSSTRLDFT